MSVFSTIVLSSYQPDFEYDFFIDTSSGLLISQFPILSGSIDVDTSQVVGESYPMIFDGNNFLFFQSDGVFGFGLDDFSIEFDLLVRSANNFETIIDLQEFGVLVAYLSVNINNMRVNVNGVHDSNQILNLNEWYRIKLSRIGGVLSLFVNDILDFNSIDAVDYGAARQLRIGSDAAGGNRLSNSSIANFSISI